MIALARLSTRAADGESAPLGILSIHLDGAPCRVGCAWCYLGGRSDARDSVATGERFPLELVEDALGRLNYEEVALAVSDPVSPARPLVSAIVTQARARQKPVTITTTPQIARREAWLCEGVSRISLSIDPDKGPVSPARVAALTAELAGRHPGIEIVLIVSLSTPRFAAQLIDEGLLAALVDVPSVHKVALNALKPPPPWCDRSFWMAALARLAPLLERALDRRLFLDCYVAARLLKLADCPARADLSPAAGRLAFRSCVYQPAPDFVAADAATLARRLRVFQPPPVCPFPLS
jgi:hypothetical protein